MKKIIIIGSGGHARSCADVIRSCGEYMIHGFVGLPGGKGIIGTDEDLPQLRSECELAIVGVGQIKSHFPRKRLFELVLQLGFGLPPIIASTAYVSPHAELGKGVVVMHGAIVNSGAQVGDNCIVNSRALIEHDVHIEPNCHVATGAILNGGVVIGEGSFIGSGSVIREGIQIASQSIIGMGSYVRHNYC